MKASEYIISKDKFNFASGLGRIHDKALETKPVTYFRDALNRFCKNKASIVAAVIIGILFLFAIIAPIASPYKVADKDELLKFARPKNQLFYDLQIPFWDGGQEKTQINEQDFLIYQAIEQELGRPVIMYGEYTKNEYTYFGKPKVDYDFRFDSYYSVGAEFVTRSDEVYKDIQKFQDETGIQVILPITEPSLRPTADQDIENADYWFLTENVNGKTKTILDSDGNYINIYQPNNGLDGYTSTLYWEGDEKLYNYAEAKDGNMWTFRVDYINFYIYSRHAEGNTRIQEPVFLFGADNAGKDIFTCLASGARFSFILAILVSSVNLFVGAIYGAIEGYYGGKIDILMERFVEIIGSVPFMIVISLLKYHLKASHILILFISFFLTGWTGMAARTRMQFYRFKHQEYVLVARTLGASDKRIMFKHIFPNALGTLITGSVLVIPGVIFSETSLSYLNIINLNSGNLTSVGTLLANGQSYMYENPHMMIFPAVFISLLMLSFNLFGNGLRDAFNPSLRGTE